MTIKIIFIYRDGRDAAASGVRHSFNRPVNKKSPPWSYNFYDNLNHWYNNISFWFNNVKEKLHEDQYMEIKFEDYIESKNEVLEKISQFLSIDIKELVKSFDENFKLEASHINQFKNIVPDWESKVSEQALSLLKRLDYVK